MKQLFSAFSGKQCKPASFSKVNLWLLLMGAYNYKGLHLFQQSVVLFTVLGQRRWREIASPRIKILRLWPNFSLFLSEFPLNFTIKYFNIYASHVLITCTHLLILKNINYFLKITIINSVYKEANTKTSNVSEKLPSATGNVSNSKQFDVYHKSLVNRLSRD